MFGRHKLKKRVENLEKQVEYLLGMNSLKFHQGKIVKKPGRRHGFKLKKK